MINYFELAEVIFLATIYMAQWVRGRSILCFLYFVLYFIFRHWRFKKLASENLKHPTTWIFKSLVCLYRLAACNKIFFWDLLKVEKTPLMQNYERTSLFSFSYTWFLRKMVNYLLLYLNIDNYCNHIRFLIKKYDPNLSSEYGLFQQNWLKWY